MDAVLPSLACPQCGGARGGHLEGAHPDGSIERQWVPCDLCCDDVEGFVCDGTGCVDTADGRGLMCPYDCLNGPSQEMIRDLIRVGAQELPHRYTGSCPDTTQPDARDPLCAACKVLVRAANLLAQPAAPQEVHGG